ncbi:TPA: hypothetical protein RJS70_000498 [Campylobacter lari]|nr:hypothetical protein [Campylobacter lari]
MSSIEQIKMERKVKYMACVISLIVVGIMLQKIDSYSNITIYNFGIIFTYILLPVIVLIICIIGIISDNKAIKHYENNQQEEI